MSIIPHPFATLPTLTTGCVVDTPVVVGRRGGVDLLLGRPDGGHAGTLTLPVDAALRLAGDLLRVAAPHHPHAAAHVVHAVGSDLLGDAS